jgi:hypothetical protein
MDTPWQLPWISARLAPLWIVEHLGGQRAARVRTAIVDGTPQQVERMGRELQTRLGPKWQVEIVSLLSESILQARPEPVDVVWALSALRGSWEERLRIAAALGDLLTPGGYLFASPTDVAAWGAALAPCSAPGVFVKIVPERDKEDTPPCPAP